MSTITSKVVVVTGAGSGIGRELSAGLARRGARLALCDVNQAGLAETVEQSKALGAETYARTVDVSDLDAVQAFAAGVVEHYGVVHQIYNNAGIAGGGTTVLDTAYAEYQRIIDVNLWGVIHGTKEFLPHLIASGDGHVINISSLNGFMAQEALSGYCASKFAVRGFTESLRQEMINGAHPVQVTVVHPAGVRTNISTAPVEEADRNGVKASEEQRRRSRIYSEKLLKMPAPHAARIILDAVEANKARVLVGADAKVIDILVRAIPGLAPRLMALWSKRTFKADHPKAGSPR